MYINRYIFVSEFNGITTNLIYYIMAIQKTITYDDTRDCAIRIIDKLIDLGLLEDNDNHYFSIQDTIQDEYNALLGLDIDDNFEINVL